MQQAALGNSGAKVIMLGVVKTIKRAGRQGPAVDELDATELHT